MGPQAWCNVKVEHVKELQQKYRFRFQCGNMTCLGAIDDLILCFMERIMVSLYHLKSKLSRSQFLLYLKVNVVVDFSKITSI
jgi:hypothetical protein